MQCVCHLETGVSIDYDMRRPNEADDIHVVEEEEDEGALRL